jgi:DASS family divalent anion:Na+ symporter
LYHRKKRGLRAFYLPTSLYVLFDESFQLVLPARFVPVRQFCKNPDTSVRNNLGSECVTTARPDRRRGLAVLVLVGAGGWVVPPPSGVADAAWHLFAIFLATIIGLVLQPVAMGAVVLMGLTATVLTGTLPIADALFGYQSATVWLIVSAFLFARCLNKTGLGRRIAFMFIRWSGHKTLGLGYALGLADLVLSPGIPSGTARTGGVLFPVVRSLSTAYGSEPGPTARRIGEFLMQCTYQIHCVTCAMFMTAMVANPLMVELAREVAGVEITWSGWAAAALVPGVVSFVLLPLMVFAMLKPEIRETPEASALARQELEQLGPMGGQQRAVLCVFGLVFLLWITGSWNALPPTAVAFLGICLLLVLNVITWDDVVEERTGWDALVWFGGLVSMATMLNRLGLTEWFSASVGGYLEGWPWLQAMAVLALVYLYAHYFFASLTAHVAALFAPFLAVAVAAGAPPYFAALTLAFLSSLCASLTHYAGGPSAVFWGAGYTDIKRWWTVGFAVSVMFVMVWMGIGSFWWRMLGLYSEISAR